METLFIAYLGAAFGSFAAATVYRLRQGIDFVNDRSICENCKHVLSWYDLLPILSYLSLRGRCRYCKKGIAPSILLFEISTAAVFALSHIAWPFLLETNTQWAFFATWLLMLTLLVVLFVYDVKWMELPTKIMYPLFALAAIYRLIEYFAFSGSFTGIITSTIAGIIVGGGLFYLIFQISGGKWIGGGDVRLGYALGAILGPNMALTALLVSFYMAFFYVVPLMLLKRISRKSKVPFGPFLILGLFVALHWGQQLRDFYFTLFEI